MENNKYQKGKIYKLVCESTGLIYIGSTIQSLNDRLRGHKNDYICFKKGTNKRYCYSYKVLENNNYKIELIKNYPCESKKELEREEGKYQQIITCCNKLVAGRTKIEYMKEYREKNKDRIKEQKKEYNKIKINCICNSIIRKSELKRHKRSKKHIKYMEQLN